jgi:HEAT repeat protein
MSENSPQNIDLALDTRLLSDFIFELTISRRCVSSYPKGHPLILASMKRVMNLLAQLLEYRKEITLGVARDSLIFEQKLLDQKNPVYRDYAKILFSHSIAAVTFEKNLEEEELLQFNEILSRNRENIRENGGISQTAHDAGIRHLQVKTVSYDLLRVVENDQIESQGDDKKSSTVWEDFVRHLLDGTLDPSGGQVPVPEQADPEILARIMNEEVWKNSRDKELSYDHVIASYIGGVFGNERDPAKRKECLDRVSRFVSNLNPELRSRFLTDTFKSLAKKEEIAEEVLTPFPEEIILETLENMNSRNLLPSPFILKLLQKLGKHQRAESGPQIDLGKVEDTEKDLTEKLGTIIREDDIETPVPRSYQDMLQSIVAAEKVTGLDLEEFEVLKKSLEGHRVNIQLSTIILEILKSGPSPDYLEALKQNLIDSVGYFLKMGDFQTLNELHSRLTEVNNSTVAEESSQVAEVLAIFEKPEFIGGVLTGFRLWGKEKYPDIKKLIQNVGKPFVKPVLDQLAEEPSRSIRHFCIEILLEMSDLVREPALARLWDRRWYFLRNLILILRNLRDPSILPALKRMLGHRHPRVREEVFKALFHFQDPDAERMLLGDLSSEEKEIQRSAVRVAEYSRSPVVFDKLLEILSRRGVFRIDFDLKIEVIRTLAKIGNPESLPHLERLLRGRSFLYRRGMNRLKAEVIRSLEFYPAPEATPLLEKVSGVSDHELTDLASRMLKNVQNRMIP